MGRGGSTQLRRQRLTDLTSNRKRTMIFHITYRIGDGPECMRTIQATTYAGVITQLPRKATVTRAVYAEADGGQEYVVPLGESPPVESAAMKPQHTQGPWCIEAEGMVIVSNSPTGQHNIAEIIGCKTGDGRANARLIAAAPDLLEAAKDALAILRCGQGNQRRMDVRDAMKAAVAKAENGDATT